MVGGTICFFLRGEYGEVSWDGPADIYFGVKSDGHLRSQWDSGNKIRPADEEVSCRAAAAAPDAFAARTNVRQGRSPNHLERR